MATQNFRVKNGLEVGSNIVLNGATGIISATSVTVGGQPVGAGATVDVRTNSLVVLGVATATYFVGDGSGLTGVTATGSGIEVRDSGSVVGTAATIDFGDNLTLSAVSAGVVTVTASGGGGIAGIDTTGTSVFNQLNVSGVSTFAGITTVSGATLFTKQLNVSGVSTFTYIQNTGITSTKEIIVFGTGNDVGSAATISLRSRNNYIDFDAAIPNTSPPQQFGIKFQGTTILGGSYSSPDGSIFLNNYNGTTALSINDSGLTLSGITTITGTTLFAKQISVSGVSTLSRLNVGTGGTIIATTSGGLVGIGTTNPTSKLTVQGDVSVSGVSTLTGNTFVGSAITMYASTGIVSATAFYGNLVGSITDATNLTGGTANAASLNVSGIATISAGRIQADAASNLRFGNIAAGAGSVRNIAIGDQVLVSLSGGSGRNIGIGELSYYDTTTGQYNIGIGERAGQKVSTGSYNVILGAYDGNSGNLDIRTSSNNIVIADGQGNIRQYINSSGNVGIKTTVITEALTVAGVVSATSYSGSGIGLTGIPAGQLTGALPVLDGSNLFGVTATGSGIQVRDDGSVVGTAATVDFGSGLSVSFGSGIATVSGASSVSEATTAYALAGTPNLNVGIVTAARLVSSGASLTSPLIVGLTTATYGIRFAADPGAAQYVTNIVPFGINGYDTAAGYQNDAYLQFSPINSNYIIKNVGIGTTNPTSKLTVSGDGKFTGVVTASSFTGSGSGLTNIPAGQLTGTLPAIDGSALLNVTAAGTGVAVRDDNSPVGSATTINFGTGLDVTFSSGIATITASGGSLQSRTVVTGVTTAIINNGIGNTDFAGFKSYALMKVGLSTAGWLRLYTDSASRTADASRSQGIDPSPGSGVIAEVITTGISTTQIITPFVMGGNLNSPVDTTIYAAITNLSGSTQAITANLTILQLEA